MRDYLGLSQELLLNPGIVLRHLDVNSGNISFTAAYAPRNDAGKLPDAVHLTDERPAAVTGACVLPLLSASAEEARVKREVLSEPGLPEHVLTLTVVHDRDFHLLEDLLVGPLREGVLAPSGRSAALSGKLDVPVWQADGTDVRVPGVVNVPVDADKCNIVEQVARVVLVVDEDVDDVELDVGVELGVVVNVPFSGTDPAIFL